MPKQWRTGSKEAPQRAQRALNSRVATADQALAVAALQETSARWLTQLAQGAEAEREKCQKLQVKARIRRIKLPRQRARWLPQLAPKATGVA